MNLKYSISRYAIGMLAAACVPVLPTACNDDLGYPDTTGQQIAFNPTISDTWYNGMSVDENAPTTHCTSVRTLSGDDDTKLYLHTVVADNPIEEKGVVSRGTLLKNEAAFKEKYKTFSLSGICYTGEYPDDESNNTWTPEYAYDLPYTTAGLPEKGSELLWPSGGHVRFFAFAPTVADFDKLKTGGSLRLSGADVKGSPTLTYTVPTDVKKQIDLMTVYTDVKAATTPEVELKFGHALTAVQIKCADDMLAGKITEVSIAGIYGSGTQVIGSDTWSFTEANGKATYTIKDEITLPGTGTDDKIHTPGGTPITGTYTDNLTFLLLPQILPDDATMTIKFTDSATQKDRTLTAGLKGHKWEAGKIVTYSVSPSSIHINAKVELNKKPETDVMPYSGVWYDVNYMDGHVEIAQDDVETVNLTIPKKTIKYQYKIGDNWVDCTTDENGLLSIAPQDAYKKMKEGFVDAELGTESAAHDLSENGETANCYLVDRAGYYSLPLVYGNGKVDGGHDDGLKYFPNYNDEAFSDANITDAADAVLCWQDAPDLIDPASVKINNGTLQFHIRKQTITQGNALLAVRNSSKEILWSWHIWVTPYKTDFYNGNFYHSVTYTDETNSEKLGEYDFTQYNLGWCDSHAHNDARTFELRAVVDMTEFGGSSTTGLDLGKFTQMEYKGSDAGDNTYYQWGRKDPMLGGIYNSKTPTYLLNGSTGEEFTMENKQVFNEYNDGEGHNYAFCKNPGDMLEPGHAGSSADIPNPVHLASNGATIGYSIRNPYMFVTNSRSGDRGASFSYRNHWHVPYKDNPAPYLSNGTHIMFNVWNATATEAGQNKGSTDYLKKNAAPVSKSVYDPCPPGFKIPPIDAFRGIANIYKGYGDYCGLFGAVVTSGTNAWTITYNGQSITFPLTGVRNEAVRIDIWDKVTIQGNSSVTGAELYKTSLPAFKKVTYLTGATIAKATKQTSAYQVLIFTIDNRYISENGGNPAMHVLYESSNSYGMSVRPIRDN